MLPATPEIYTSGHTLSLHDALPISNGIGDDHGDPYEVAMLAGEVGTEMQVTAKEILDHLRAALDYCARQVWQEISAAPAGALIYFPIDRKSTRLNSSH